MKAMVLNRCASITTKPLRECEIPTPTPKDDELLVRITHCAICRTDLHVIEGELPHPSLPLVPGHQAVGKVVALGASCRRLSVGTRVGIAWLRETCEHCSFCRRDQENLCSLSRYTGYHADGGYAEFAVVKESYAYELTSTLTGEELAPLLCAGIIGYRSLIRSELPSGGRLGIFGFGSSAHITMQVALSKGAKVYVSTRGIAHQRLARSMGATWVCDSSTPFPEKVDSAIVFAPAGELVPFALQGLERGGTLSIAGIHMSDIPSLNYESHLFHEKTLRSVEANTREDGIELLRTAAVIPIRPKVVVYPLAAANEALIDLKNDNINGTGVLFCGND